MPCIYERLYCIPNNIMRKTTNLILIQCFLFYQIIFLLFSEVPVATSNNSYSDKCVTDLVCDLDLQNGKIHILTSYLFNF